MPKIDFNDSDICDKLIYSQKLQNIMKLILKFNILARVIAFIQFPELIFLFFTPETLF